ncbi:UPF0389 protein CG9231 [Solenopsis invicta]|uniref:UPF0389 protein CG9231 n=1 Tax=Solenopsis invicta TaxID=13686 RepID=UPI000596211A|nr:UPF0389 protein CG9231 [Solenopsis invicta]
MLSRQFARSAHLNITTRCFNRSSIIREINKIPAQKSSETVKGTENVIGSQMHRVTGFDKTVLVWVKRYPSIAEVPKDVTVNCMLTARSKARIKACQYMIGFTLIGCLTAAIIGRKAAARGENLLTQRQEWYQKNVVEDKNK